MGADCGESLLLLRQYVPPYLLSDFVPLSDIL